MNRRTFLKALGISAATVAAGGCSTIFKRKRPNIIFIMTDDHTRQAMGCYGSKINKTPNLDRIGNEGIRFDNCFVTNSICAPSRAVIQTGKFSHLNGVTDNVREFDGSQQTFPKLLQANGYQTAMIGKWHLKSEPIGFDFWKVLPGQGNYYNPYFRTPGGDEQIQGYVTDIVTDVAIEWLENSRDSEKPFLLMYQHKAPHRGWWPGQAHMKDFEGEAIPEPETLFDDYDGRGRAAKEQDMSISKTMGPSRDLKLKPEQALGVMGTSKNNRKIYDIRYNFQSDAQKKEWDATYDPRNKKFVKAKLKDDDVIRWKYQRYIKDYLRCVASVDDNVGRLLDYLKEEGLDENTLLIYTSDQGFYLGEHGWFDKRFMYEESFSTPLVMRWPGKIKPGTTSEALVQNLDFAETMLDAAGVPVPDDMQGVSLLPLVKGKTPADWRDAVYYHYYEYPGVHKVKRHYGIRTEQYKLIHFYHDIDEWELYDLEKDPQEMNNVYNDPAYLKVAKKLLVRLKELQKQYGDSDKLAQDFIKDDERIREERRKKREEEQKNKK